MPKIDVSVILLSGAALALLGLAGPVGALAVLALGITVLAIRPSEPRVLRVRADQVAPRPAPRRLP